MVALSNQEQIKENFVRDGYVAIRGFLNSAQVENASQQIRHFIDEVLPQLDQSEAMFEDRERPQTIKQIPNLSTHSPFFQEMLQTDRFADLAKSLLCDQVSPIGVQWFDRHQGQAHRHPPTKTAISSCSSLTKL